MESSESVPELYQKLNFSLKKNDFDRVLSLSNRILEHSPKDEKAFQCKMFAFISLNRFEDALQQITRNKDKFPRMFSFERAYCEYRLNRLQESLSTLKTLCDPKELRCQELTAQVLYRQEEFDEAASLYLAIIKDSTDEFSHEREANLAAVNASSCVFGKQSVCDVAHFSEETYEVCFNNATALVSEGHLEEALEKLEKAKQLCLEYFEDEADEELAPCLVQQAYILQLQGKQSEANEIYQKLLKDKPKDTALLAVISNNVVCINRDQNIFDSKKRIKVATADGLKHKLFATQKQQIALNQCLLQYFSNQGDACKKAALQHLKDDSANEIAALIYASQLVKEKNFSEAIRFLTKFCSDMQDRQSVVAPRLTLAQILLQQNSISQCITQLLSLPHEVLFTEKIITAIMTLYSSMENKEAACKFLDDACAYFASSDSDDVDYEKFLKRCARINESCGYYKRAAELYRELLKGNPGNQKIIALLVNAYANFDAAKAEETSRLLKTSKIPRSSLNIPLDQLESCLSLGSRYTKKVTPKDVGDTKEDDIIAKRRHKKKKGKLPKHFDPNVPADAERWLPRRERSYYRGKKKDRRAGKLARGNQGSSAASGQLDFGAKSAKADPAVSTSPKPEPEPAPSKPAQQSKQPSSKQNKKKKSKGRGW